MSDKATQAKWIMIGFINEGAIGAMIGEISGRPMPTDWMRILFWFYQHGDFCSAMELATHLGMHEGRTSEELGEMESEGYLQFEAGNGYHLTQSGTELMLLVADAFGKALGMLDLAEGIVADEAPV